jgi:AcrR family transcriptional regulator
MESKSTEERQIEILDAAAELFSTKGYDKTSTSDIMKAVGIAKGTLYYHFSSKEEILDALIDRIASNMVSRATAIASDKTVSVPDRITRVILSLNVNTHGEGQIIETLHNPQNALFHQKSLDIVIERITPILAGIVKEGIEQGLFSTVYPESSIRMVMTYAMIAFEDVQNITSDIIAGFIYNLERVFGAKTGTFHNLMENFM